MGFWIYMLIMVLLIPITMIGFGWLFMKKAPEDINVLFGYRTKRSMKNNDTWLFAHHFIGKLWYICGMILVPISILPMLFAFGKDSHTVGTVGAIIQLVQVIPLVGTIFPTECALKKHFDDLGRPR